MGGERERGRRGEPARHGTGWRPRAHPTAADQGSATHVVGVIQTSGGSASGATGHVRRSAVHDVLTGSAGVPLASSLREEMETRLGGADFSGVRLHTGPLARTSAAELGARAYTAGDHVVMGTGASDKRTLAHELTHVLQQREGPVAGTDRGDGLSVSSPGDRFEREADVVAGQAMSIPLQPISLLDQGVRRSRTGQPRQVQRAFEGILQGMTKDDLEEILPHYGIPADDASRVLANWEALEKSPRRFSTIPELLERVFPGREREQITEAVKAELIERVGTSATAKEMVHLERADNRDFAQIKAAGGFFGRGPVPLGHARKIAVTWNAMTRQQKKDWAQAWKAQTAGNTVLLPYVATGKEAQKAGHEYAIDIPMFRRPTLSGLTPELLCDAENPADATVIAIEMRGECLFVTGIPLKYISEKK